MTEILLPRIARRRIRVCLISEKFELEQLELNNLSSMRVSNRIIPPSDNRFAASRNQRHPSIILLYIILLYYIYTYIILLYFIYIYIYIYILLYFILNTRAALSLPGRSTSERGLLQHNMLHYIPYYFFFFCSSERAAKGVLS